MKVLTRVSYNCPSCGLDYNFLIYVNNNELMGRVGNVKQKCSKCESIVDANIEEIQPPYIQVEGDRVKFLGYNIMKLTDDKVTFDIRSLMNMGFCGEVGIVGSDDTQIIAINPIYKKAKLPEMKKKINKTVRLRRPTISTDTPTLSLEEVTRAREHVQNMSVSELYSFTPNTNTAPTLRPNANRERRVLF